ncbi:hypothetical protein MNBD_NITROSPINAE04-2388 [hydrothermal vent metagenome]|uniref:FlgN protein n=1 Tax=hydrothermal vent metagenome TaxID=652676 RepID=A0A3B1BVF4_9ZZZZ
MKRLESLIESLIAQKKLYSQLLICSEKLNASVSSGSDSDRFVPMIVERDAIMEKLNAGDEKIGVLLSSPENRDLLKNERVDKLRKEIIAVVEKIENITGELIEAARQAKGKVINELDSLKDGKKTVSGYGKAVRPVYAKFIDFKH